MAQANSIYLGKAQSKLNPDDIKALLVKLYLEPRIQLDRATELAQQEYKQLSWLSARVYVLLSSDPSDKIYHESSDCPRFLEQQKNNPGKYALAYPRQDVIKDGYLPCPVCVKK